MNKDVIYIEPENDITDIIGKIEGSPERIVVLVPPKKAGMFRSMVNIKLMAKIGENSGKTVVIVTSDPSITKLAAAARIPVTKDLKVPPKIPELDDEMTEAAETEVVEMEDSEEEDADRGEGEDGEKVPVNDPSKATRGAGEASEDESAHEPEEDPKAAKKAAREAKKAKKRDAARGGGLKNWIKNHKIPVIIGGVVLVGLIAFCIWAFNIAPAVSVTVEMQTENKSFAENATFTTNPADENASEGKFYLEELKTTESQEIQFQATGKQNQGEKASGKATVYATVGGPYPDTVSVPSGTTVTIQGQSFTVQEGTTLELEDDTPCEGSAASAAKNGCKVQGNVTLVANGPGDQYNLSFNNTAIGISNVTMSGSTSGGTNKEVAVVEQIDIEKAKDQLKSTNEEAIKQKLFAQAKGDNTMIIENSFSVSTDNATATPAAGQEVGSGVTPVLKATTTATVYTVDTAKLKEFIEKKAQIGDDQKIYQISDPYIENFVLSNGSGSGRLKANYSVGPKLNEGEVAEKIRGKGIGDAQHSLKSINGVVSVRIDGNYPWVTSVPDDTNKITVEITVKDQNGGSEKNSENGSDSEKNDSANRGGDSAEGGEK